MEHTVPVIDMKKVERIWLAERELQEAIDDGVTSGILVEVSVDRFTSGTQAPRILVKKVIFPDVSEIVITPVTVR